MSNYSLSIQELMVYRESSPFCTDLTRTSWTQQIFLLCLPCTIRDRVLPSGLSALERETSSRPCGHGGALQENGGF